MGIIIILYDSYIIFFLIISPTVSKLTALSLASFLFLLLFHLICKLSLYCSATQ